MQDYESVELGFPSIEDELINEYAEDEPYTEDMYLMGKSYYEENIK